MSCPLIGIAGLCLHRKRKFIVTTIKQRLARGESVRVFLIGAIPNHKIIEVVSLAGNYQGVWVDQEHSAVPHQQLEVLMLACRSAQLDAFVRVPPTDYGTIMRPMEAGANGIMAAQIRTVDQVQQVVQWAKYPPVGVRGMFRANYEAGFGTRDPSEIAETSNRDRWLAIQIETPEAVDCVDEIAAIDEVDSLFVGPGDLSVTLGVPGQPMHPKCIAALERVSAAVKAAGKSWGVLPFSREHAAKCRELGCQLFSIGSDMELIRRGLQATETMFG